MSVGLSPGTAWIAIAEGKAADAGPTVTPEVSKLVPDAVRRVRDAKENIALHDVDVQIHEKTIELVFLPRLAPGEELHPGGGTSLGKEVHVHYDRATGAFVRLHWAR